MVRDPPSIRPLLISDTPRAHLEHTSRTPRAYLGLTSPRMHRCDPLLRPKGPLAALGAVTRRRASEGSGLAAARARLYVEGDTAAGAGLEVAG